MATPVAGLGAACSDGGYINKQSTRIGESFSILTTDFVTQTIIVTNQ